MPINMSIEYPKLQAENAKLKALNDELVEALRDAQEEINNLMRQMYRPSEMRKHREENFAYQKAKAALAKATQQK